jgi:uracil-DNA glycosylase
MVVLALGKSAARLFGIRERVRQAHRKRYQIDGGLLKVTYHPAYVLRFAGRGSKLWHQTVADIRSAWISARTAGKSE